MHQTHMLTVLANALLLTTKTALRFLAFLCFLIAALLRAAANRN